MKANRFLAVLALLLATGTALGQATQTIRGSLTDKDTRGPMIGANVGLYQDSTLWGGSSADLDGRYRIADVPVGRYTLVVTFLGYHEVVVPNVQVSSGKELIVNLQMEERVRKLDEVTISAQTNKGETLNKMATVSAREFSVEETERYAGSRGDPARMASNFAGVNGADDSRNDIVVRGNSPLGVLWRLEGINIPNPNHFAIAGSQGGPVSVLNNKVLANSDFFTGAFPAEYGNSTAAVFDIRMRNGNNEQHEFTGQFGFLGTELTAEGPISKKNGSSYLANYRYSTLALFGGLGISIGTTAIPRYQDGAFKLNFPGKKGGFSVFGIGGTSDIDILISNRAPEEREIYGEQDRDQYFGTDLGVIGANYHRRFGDKTYGRISVAQSYSKVATHHQLIYNPVDSATGEILRGTDGLFLIDSLVDFLRYNFRTYTTSANAFVNHKINARHVLKAGVISDVYTADLQDSVYNADATYDWNLRWDYHGSFALLQAYAQWKWKITDALTLNTGLHSQYMTLSGSLAPIEPRVGLRWQLNDKSRLSGAVGLHSQMQPLYTYFYASPGSAGQDRYNIDMDFTRSMHYVLGYDRRLGKNMRMKLETYYQQLYDVPVTKVASSFSLVNQGSGFVRFFPDSLENTGTGENYGLDFTLEKFFSRRYLFMLTASVYESFYTGSDGITRDTDFNGNYVLNALGSKEFKTGTRSTLTIGSKFTYAGNKRFGPVDTSATVIAREIIYADSTRNSFQFDPYLRVDLKVNYRINAKRVTHEIGLDLVNITSRQNVLKLSYAPDPDDANATPIREEYQLGFLPIFYYKIDF